MKRAKQGGHAALWALMAVFGAATVIGVGLELRTAELGTEQRALCRVQARSAAESGIARARAMMESGQAPPPKLVGTLDGGPRRSKVSYETAVHSSARATELLSDGFCDLPGKRRIGVRIAAGFARNGTRLAVASWSEAPVPGTENGDGSRSRQRER